MDVKKYAIVTAAYWSFTLTDGALRMLVLLHFHQLGYSALEISFVFLLYEFCGIVTNLYGGWIAARHGLRITLFAGLALQILALILLSFVGKAWVQWFSVLYVMLCQALSGVAKDLTKMSSKSAVKLVVGGDESSQQSQLFRWVAVLTGSKNALKGVGFFIGGFLLGSLGFKSSLLAMAGMLGLVLLLLLTSLKTELGKSQSKAKIKQLLSKSPEINLLSLARFFLFGSRDVWFVVGLPIFLASELKWSFSSTGAFLAAWVIGYGIVQAYAPKFIGGGEASQEGVKAAQFWAGILFMVTLSLVLAVQYGSYLSVSIVVGLTLFGIVFAINSAIHSYLILAFSDADKVTLNVGFYYMANACGRLVGTALSGLLFIVGGLNGCLWMSCLFVLAATVVTYFIPLNSSNMQTP